MIEIQSVRKSFGNLEVLKGIDLKIEKGEVLCLIGASGSGKSTLLQCINGLEPIHGGKIIVDGTDVHGRGTDLNLLRQKLGIVFQQYNAFPHLTALQNVALAPRVVAISRCAQSRRFRAQRPSNWRARIWSMSASAAESTCGPLDCQEDNSSAWQSHERWRCSRSVPRP